jgi:hypothetical protein
MASLSGLRQRLENQLKDSGNRIWAASELDEAIRCALDDVNLACPRAVRQIVTLERDGSEIELNISGLLDVVDVWYPFESSRADSPPNRVQGWTLTPGNPLILELRLNGRSPASGEKLRLDYTAAHTLAGLNGAESDSLPAVHEGIVLRGAAVYAALARTAERGESFEIDPQAPQTLIAYARQQAAVYQEELARLRRQSTWSGRAFPRWEPET